MTNRKYVHGYSPTEQDRLVAQAMYWRDLILLDLEYVSGQSVLEIGCGVGAVMGLIGKQFPGIKLAGIDIQEAQIEYARKYLPSIGILNAQLVVGDAARLPWPDASFDHIFLIWIIEHLRCPEAVLQEAFRVLKPGGSITLTETDYASITTYPPSAEYDDYMQQFIKYFNQNGDAYVGRRLGSLLEASGLEEVTNRVIGYNWWNSQHAEKMAAHIDYLLEFIEPLLSEVAAETDCDLQRLEAGASYFKSLKSRPDAAISHMFYRAVGWKSAITD